MWKNIDFDEIHRRISLVAIAIWEPIFKLIEFVDDRLPTPVAILVLLSPLVLAQWLLPVWVYSIPFAIVALSGMWMLIDIIALALDSELRQHSRRRR
ncbi:hypothetical protein [Azospira oryzae]|uniref:hypothetical protein n=1 Tax=Azospira oryzae TaxID=146939 RepID=UPI001965127B|nr:hypothetical protein [Azospira oryzae]